MNKVYIVIEYDTKRNGSIVATFSSPEKAFRYIEDMEDANDSEEIIYDMQCWLVDYI